MKKVWLFIICFILLSLSNTEGLNAKENPWLSVLKLESEGLSETEKSNLGNALEAELEKLDKFRIKMTFQCALIKTTAVNAGNGVQPA